MNLSIVFGSRVLIIDDGINSAATALAVRAFAALYFLKLDVLLVVAAGGLFGLLKYLMFG